MYWTDGTYPVSVLIILIENHFLWDKQERCWKGKCKNEILEKIIKFADELKVKNNGIRTESTITSLSVQDEIEFFEKLKTNKDYMDFLENIRNDEDYITHCNAEKWEKRSENMEMMLKYGDLYD